MSQLGREKFLFQVNLWYMFLVPNNWFFHVCFSVATCLVSVRAYKEGIPFTLALLQGLLSAFAGTLLSLLAFGVLSILVAVSLWIYELAWD